MIQRLANQNICQPFLYDKKLLPITQKDPQGCASGASADFLKIAY